MTQSKPLIKSRSSAIAGYPDLTSIVRFKSYARDLLKTFLHQLIDATRSRSDGPHEETSIRSTDAQSRLLIARKRNPMVTNQFRSFKNRSSQRRTCSRFVTKFSMFKESFRVPFVSLCSQLISTSIEYLKSNFHQERRKKSYLELHFHLRKLE